MRREVTENDVLRNEAHFDALVSVIMSKSDADENEADAVARDLIQNNPRLLLQGPPYCVSGTLVRRINDAHAMALWGDDF